MAAAVPIEYPEPVYGYGPPYTPQVAAPGLIPTIPVDVPVCIILIIFFVAAAGLNLAILLRNLGRNHKFLFSSVLVGFCVTRIIALSLRIAWATQPWNVRIDIAGTVFASAGVVLLYIITLIFAHRLLCGLHPNIGWIPAVVYFFYFCYFLLIVSLICALSAFIANFYTLDPEQLHNCHLVQLFASTVFAIFALLPILIVLFAAFYPGLRCPEPFGYGSLTAKIVIVLAVATLLSIGAIYTCAANYAVRPVWFPGWWDYKVCYYIFLFALELVVVFLYSLSRFDLRFHIPDGACKAGDFIKCQHTYKRVSGLTLRASLDERITVHVDDPVTWIAIITTITITIVVIIIRRLLLLLLVTPEVATGRTISRGPAT
ncbi:hypothetical protein LX32DRAFT_724377 [Colletotrichum zoysiae]|uniref:Uncharacterized protein n=1 Tax=Colletotrichum zoysiae TaxID=1216348 RepID=A0AAD9HU66_9PEZI|nr:hypothetical protein LX32DRAFT_724377 [Colletotrichum zoysiae]